VTISPDENRGENCTIVTFNVTVKNNGSCWDKYTLDLSDSLTWPELSWLPTVLTTKLGPSKDTYVDENNPDTNYGTYYKAYVGGDNDNREMFIAFDLSSISANSISSAKLYMEASVASAAPFWASAIAVDNDTWGETTITWSDKPALGSVLDSVSGFAKYVWYSWDVTTWIQSQYGDGHDNVASICIRAMDNTPPDNLNTYFNPREYSTAAYRPYLQVTYTTYFTTTTLEVPENSENTKSFQVHIPCDAPVCTRDLLTVKATSYWDNTVTNSDTAIAHCFFGYAVDENVAPASQNVPVLTIATIYDNLYNTGANTDDLIENVYDSLGWISPINAVRTGIPGGGVYNEIISVLVLPPIGATDTITMIVTSANDPSKTVTKTVTVTAIASTELGLVYVEILPGNLEAHASSVGDTLVDPCYTYDPLTLAVKVSNLGRLDDKYELTVTGPAGVGLKLTPDELFVPADDAEYASLSVTIPDSWVAYQGGTVTVTATGMLASINQIPQNWSDSADVVVSAGLVRSVAIEVLPDSLEPQTGAPGSPLVWLVVIKNTGNAPDDFMWSCSDVLSGKSSASAPRSDWGAKLDSTSPVSLDPCTKAINYLRVTVPGDAKTSEWDTITVDIEGLDTPRKEYIVKAHVVEPGPRIPEGVIEISVEAQIVAIEVWPNTWDFGVLDEDKVGNTPTDNYFTVRNTGNVDELIKIKGTDAQSMPGEPVTMWTLSDVSIGVDQYMMWVPGVFDLSKTNKDLVTLSRSAEYSFGLGIRAPSAITTPARMWARVKLTAVKA